MEPPESSEVGTDGYALHRDAEGRWSIHGMAPDELELKRTWSEEFPRYLTVLDELFHRALNGCEFEFVHTLLGVPRHR